MSVNVLIFFNKYNMTTKFKYNSNAKHSTKYLKKGYIIFCGVKRIFMTNKNLLKLSPKTYSGISQDQAVQLSAVTIKFYTLSVKI